MKPEPTLSYEATKKKFRVYRDSGTRLEYVDAAAALNAADAAREVVKKHHDWRTDGEEWSVIVVPADAMVSVSVKFEPKATVAA